MWTQPVSTASAPNTAAQQGPKRPFTLEGYLMASQFLVYLPACRRSTAAFAERRSTTDLPCCPNRSPCTELWERRAARTCRPKHTHTQSYPHIPQLQITGGGCHVTVANLNIYINIYFLFSEKCIFYILPFVVAELLVCFCATAVTTVCTQRCTDTGDSNINSEIKNQ